MKVCGGCAVEQEKAMFSRNAAAPDGLYSICRTCKAARNKARRSKPEAREREAILGKARYEANKDAISLKRKKRYAAQTALELARNLRWREKNLERHRALCRKWAQDHHEAMRAIVARRRAIKHCAEGSHTAEDVAALFDAQDGRCPMCFADLRRGYHVDHIYPLSRGGGDGPDNLQLLCPTCNRSKGAKLPSEVLRVIRVES